MGKFDCFCIGRSCVDYLSLVENFPKKNSKVPLLNYKTDIGGQSAIFAITLSRLGLKVGILTVVGDDFAGKFVSDILTNEGVFAKYIQITKKISTPVAFVWTEKNSAERTIVYQKSNLENIFRKELLEKIFNNSKLVFLDHQGLRYTHNHLNLIKKFSHKIIFDAERINKKILTFLPYVKYLFCSEDFIHEFAKKFNLKDIPSAIKKLSSQKYLQEDKVVCCTLGEKGAVAIYKGKIYQSDAVKVRVVDTTGAGDVFHAAFIYGILKNWNIGTTLKFANYVAGKSCEGLGGREKIPYLKNLSKK